MHCLKYLCAVIAALGISASVCAEELPFYKDEFVSISWPQNVKYSECSAELRQKAGIACRMIGENGDMGAVFMTMHEGYALGSVDALQKHLDDSQNALADISNIHVMTTRILKESPLIGMMEIIRKDGNLNDIAGLQHGEIRQSSLLIPVDDRLVQLFVYLPMDDLNSPQILQAFVENWQSHCEIYRAPVEPVQAGAEVPEGALSLMPRAAWIGCIIALIVILMASIRRRIDRARRMSEDRKLQIQLEACSNAQEAEAVSSEDINIQPTEDKE